MEGAPMQYTGQKTVLRITTGFLPFMVFPVTCEHFRGHLNIIGGSYSKIKSCQVIIELFHLFLLNFDP